MKEKSLQLDWRSIWMPTSSSHMQGIWSHKIGLLQRPPASTVKFLGHLKNGKIANRVKMLRNALLMSRTWYWMPRVSSGLLTAEFLMERKLILLFSLPRQLIRRSILDPLQEHQLTENPVPTQHHMVLRSCLSTTLPQS